MPDITLCRRDCPSSAKCYRHMATPDEAWQSYFGEPYPPIVDGKCEHYWPMVEKAMESKEGKNG